MLDLSPTNLFDPITTHLNTVLSNLPTALVTLLVGILVIRVLSAISGWLISFIRLPRGLREILHSIINAVLGLFLVIVVLQTLQLNNAAVIVTALVAGLGIALGNGAIPLATDVVSGIYLGRDRYFSIGDIVEVGEPGFDRTQGEVMGLDLRRTRIKDKDGLVHSFPNTLIERHSYVLISKKRDRTDTA